MLEAVSGTRGVILVLNRQRQVAILDAIKCGHYDIADDQVWTVRQVDRNRQYLNPRPSLHIDDLDCVLHEWLGLPVDTVVLPEIVHLHLASPKDVMDTPWTIGDKTFETFGSADR
jgi:hypothetical protein